MNIIWPDAIYRSVPIEEFDGNKLIECLPPILSEEEFVRAMTSFPTFSPEERLLPTHYRIHLIKRLETLLIPTREMVKAHNTLDVELRRGYVARDPRAPAARRAMYGLPEGGKIELDAPPDCLLVTGLSGSGKSTLLRAILNIYPQVIVHHGLTPGIKTQSQVVWLKVDCPHDAGLRGLCFEIFEALDKLLGTNYLREWSSSRSSVDELLKNIAQIIYNLNVGVLVLDELQHLRVAKAGGREKMLNFLLNLINCVGVPMIFGGTYALEGIVEDQLRDARRATGTGTVTVPRLTRSDPMWSIFVRTLWKYQWVATPLPLTPDIEDALYDCTQGIRDCLVKLFAGAQKLALEKGVETVDAGVLREAFDGSFKPMHAALALLRAGTPETDPMFDELLKNDLTHALNASRRDAKSSTTAEQFGATPGTEKSRTKSRSPAICDREAELPQRGCDIDVGGTDLREPHEDVYEYLASNGMIEKIHTPQSLLLPVG